MLTTATDQKSTMKAVVCPRYGSPDVLELQEVDKPVVKDDDVLVRVKAASVNALDWRLLSLPYLFRILGNTGLFRPKRKIWGVDLAGRVEAVGKNITQLRPGDEVFGMRAGAFAEYVCVREDRLVRKPPDLSFEQAAAIPVAASTALQGLRDKGRIRPGQKVLINGASGGVGTFAVQIAKSFGAEVTGVCSKRNVDLVRSLGADHVIDYTQEDFTKSGQRYDLILDNVGNRSLSDCRRVLTSNGILVLAGAPKSGHRILARLVKAFFLSRFLKQKLVSFMAKNSQADLVVLKELIEAGKVTPVIDRRYPLSQAPDAVRYLEEGHPRAKVVITV